MRFIFLVPRYHTNLHDRISALKSHGHEVEVFALYRGRSENYSSVMPVVLGYSPIFNLLSKLFNKNHGRLIKTGFELNYGYPSIFKLFFKIKKAKPDVLIIKNMESVYSFVAMVIGLLLNKKILVLLQIEKFRKKEKSLSVQIAGIIPGAKVITPILGDRKHINKNKNLYYIPFAIKTEEFEKEYFKDGKINIICVGKFQERKGQLDLLQAVNLLKKEFDFKVSLIGQDDEEKYMEILIEYIQKNNLAEIVDISFNMKHEDVFKVYKESDLFILPSWSEAASVSVLEAMASKLAVITSDGNGTKCYIEEGKNGYIFKKKNTQDLIDKIRKIVSDKQKLIGAGMASYEIVKKNHLPEVFYRDFMKLVK